MKTRNKQCQSKRERDIEKVRPKKKKEVVYILGLKLSRYMWIQTSQTGLKRSPAIYAFYERHI